VKVAPLVQAVSPESFESLAACWADPGSRLHWPNVFVLPAWLKAWWEVFGAGAELWLASVRSGRELIGLAPLQIRGGEASFVGGPDVCDYQDFVVQPGREAEFFDLLLDQLQAEGVARLDLGALRPESTVLNHLVGLARERGWPVSLEPEGTTLELDLPGTWDQYLAMLNGKQRHEIKRKLRRLEEAAEFSYRVVDDPEQVGRAMPVFLKLFRESRQDKTTFMTTPMEAFFNLLAGALAEVGVLRLGFLDLNGRPAAAVMCFDFDGAIFLYNSGFDPDLSSLSPGIICKVLSLRDGLERGRSRYDFLKGAEAYKHRLGGREVPLSRCRIVLDRAGSGSRPKERVR